MLVTNRKAQLNDVSPSWKVNCHAYLLQEWCLEHQTLLQFPGFHGLLHSLIFHYPQIPLTFKWLVTLHFVNSTLKKKKKFLVSWPINEMFIGQRTTRKVAPLQYLYNCILYSKIQVLHDLVKLHWSHTITFAVIRHLNCYNRINGFKEGCNIFINNRTVISYKMQWP